jgi:PAS domain S-box-containing protein
MTTPSPSTSFPSQLAENLFQAEHLGLLRAVLDYSSEGLGVVDAKGHSLYMNGQCRKLLGLGLTNAGPDDWSTLYGLFYPDARTPCPSDKLPLHRALLGEEEPAQDLFIRNAGIPEGRHVHLSARAVHGAQGSLLGAFFYIRDTHEQRQAEARRRLTEQRFQFMVENAHEGVWMLDTDNRITYVNRCAAELLGYVPEEMIGRHLFDFIYTEERELSQNNLEAQRQGRSVIVNDFRLPRKDGTHIWTMVSAGPLNDEGGNYLGSLAMVADISHRREAEERMRQANAELERRIAERTEQLEFSNRELEAFAYSVAHDLRAPLRSISNFTLALTEDCADKLDATGLDYLQRIRASSKRMAELIDGILALSRVNRTEFVETNVNLSALAHSISEQLQRWQPERTLRFHIQEGLVDRGDAHLLRSVLENLLGNAWKFTRDRPMAEIEFGTLPAGSGKGRVYFVRDNGAGFDMEYQQKLFGVFQRLHTQQEFEGTGVGLATVQRIIRRHGGRIWGEGRVDQGATFYFTLHESAGTPPASGSPSHS